VVPDDQLSLAIGKKGQNARLAAKLTGWRIDIGKMERPENLEFADKLQRAVDGLMQEAPELPPETAVKLVGNGFLSIEGILAAEIDDLAGIDGISRAEAESIFAVARGHGQS